MAENEKENIGNAVYFQLKNFTGTLELKNGAVCGRLCVAFLGFPHHFLTTQISPLNRNLVSFGCRFRKGCTDANIWFIEHRDRGKY